MKVLRGTLKETLFAWPEEGEGETEKLTPMTVTKAMTHNQDAVTYINGKSTMQSHFCVIHVIGFFNAVKVMDVVAMPEVLA